MNPQGFLAARADRWEELSQLVDQAEDAGLHRLSVSDAQRLVALYRAASGDLMMARAGAASAEVTDPLNDLVSRAYVVVYRGPRVRLGEVGGFLLKGFPRLFRKHLAAIALSAMFFGAGGVFGAVGVWVDPTGAAYLVDEQHRDSDPADRVAGEEGGGIAKAGEQATFSAFLFTHNIRVSFLAFVLGVTFGVGTALVLFINGVTLGSLAVVYHQAGEGLFFWAWILPHGIPELTAVCIAGGAGLLLGRAMISAPRSGRSAALRRAGPDAVRLVLGLMPVFVVSGIIEGTISQIHEPRLPYPAKLLFALVVASALVAWLARAGRGAERGAEP
jgi:uncharacterized membrane protein SpoIIM required for sporulation